ncbi:ATP-binding protein [Brumicola blandensis]|uniref:histidine kinase n=1 Tax=Brumicola blandensis TaxID=3075611 RepID=A0AAW8R1K8_9ALTE|nr:ATP-binding protein [Alteromonas sp. W409]MDT0582038.1 ATP-binding protein [Alteromonas sp. W409]
MALISTHKFSQILRRINPSASIFARVFIWFWFATIILIATTAYLARQVFFELEIHDIDPSQLLELSMIEQDLNKYFQSLDAESLDPNQKAKALFEYSTDNKIFLIALPAQDPLQALSNSLERDLAGELNASINLDLIALPPPVIPSNIQLQIFKNQQELKRFDTSSAAYYGPLNLSIGDERFLVFRAVPKPLAWFVSANQNSPKFLALLSVLLSGVFCFALVRTLLKPIKGLQEATSQMANGQLNYRMQETKLGKDELGELGRQFNTMAARIEQQMLAQKRLLADISHELKTPLARQSIALDLIHQQKDQAQQILAADSISYDEHLQRIEKENKLINEMIGSLLTLSRQELDETRQQEVFQIGVVIQDLVDDAAYENTRITVSFDNHLSQALLLNTNRQLLSSGLENILRNGLKYAKSFVLVSLRQEGKTLNITIEDDGCGVEEEELSNIFKPFVRVSKARDRISGGAGLGLAIAQKAIDAMKGDIEANNNEYGGLTVSVILPIDLSVEFENSAAVL